jgi:hypothetical protein
MADRTAGLRQFRSGCCFRRNDSSTSPSLHPIPMRSRRSCLASCSVYLATSTSLACGFHARTGFPRTMGVDKSYDSAQNRGSPSSPDGELPLAGDRSLPLFGRLDQCHNNRLRRNRNLPLEMDRWERSKLHRFLTEEGGSPPGAMFYRSNGLACFGFVPSRHYVGAHRRPRRQLDEAHPLLNAQLPDGSRLAAVLPPVVRPNPAVTLLCSKIRFTDRACRRR